MKIQHPQEWLEEDDMAEDAAFNSSLAESPPYERTITWVRHSRISDIIMPVFHFRKNKSQPGQNPLKGTKSDTQKPF